MTDSFSIIFDKADIKGKAMNELFVFHEDRLVGLLNEDAERQFVFTYDEGWLSEEGFAISLSLPLQAEPFMGGPSQRFFSNLLPEGMVRQLLTRRLGISEDNDFQLLAAIGGECAGALTVIKQKKLPKGGRPFEYRELRREQLDHFLSKKSALPEVDGQNGLRLSLAGAQDKLPVLYEDGQLYLPVGNAPSSHILKFPNKEFKHLPANEVLTTLIARETGLNVVDAVLLRDVAREPLCLVKRYDREKNDAGKLERFHQEDFCQALQVGASFKYEAEGGPSIARCFDVVSRHSMEPLLDSRALIDWTAFNTAVGNADAHGKNISILYDKSGRIRLAPFYDLVCTTAYPRISTNLAMTLGGCKRAGQLLPKHIEQLALELKVGKRFLVNRYREQFELIGQAVGVGAATFQERYGPLPIVQMTVPKIRKSIRKLLASF